MFIDETNIPFKSWMYIGETENLYQRIGNYLNADRSQKTNFRLKKDFKCIISKGFNVRLDTLFLDIYSEEYRIKNPFKDPHVRKLVEKLIIQYYENQGVHLLNDPQRKTDPEYQKLFSV